MIKSISAITPQEAALEAKNKKFPHEVVKAFNDAICENLSNGYAKLLQDDVIAAIIANFIDAGYEHVTREVIFKNKWLDIEDFYRSAGWKVVYDKPGYCESYNPFWEFTRM